MSEHEDIGDTEKNGDANYGTFTKQVSRSASSVREALGEDGTVTQQEVWGWYIYDWANSPFYQVLDVIMKILLKRLAEFAEGVGSFPAHVMSAGSYPAAVMWFTAALQVVCLLSFSAFGDFGDRKKHLLKVFTFAGSTIVLLTIICFFSSLWWLAGVFRILAGVCFILCDVYYNSFLPLLVSSHYKVVGLEGKQRTEMEVELTNEMSARGFLTGYAGGMSLQVISFVILFCFECDSATTACSEFDRLFWLCLCIASVGVWWAAFSLYSFKQLKSRAGPPFPGGINIFCFGWTQAWETLCAVVNFRQTLLFIVAYFIWSDALATALNVAVLIMDDDGGKDSSVVLSATLATLAGLIGIFAFMNLQKYFELSTKVMLLSQLCAFVVICVSCGCGIVTAFDGRGFYIVMAPVAFMMGSLQANTRSLYSSLSLVGREAAMFSFYAIMDKGSSLIGTAVIGVVHTTTQSYVGVFWYCVFAFVFSAVILCFIDVERGLVDAGQVCIDGQVVRPQLLPEATPPP